MVDYVPMSERVAIALICPQCGEQTSEVLAFFQSRYRYSCRNTACDYVFDLTQGDDRAAIQKLADACNQIDAITKKVA